MKKKENMKLWIIQFLLMMRLAWGQIAQVEGPSEQNLLYQMVIPKGQSRTLFYIHSKGFSNCTLKFEFYSVPTNSQDDEKGYKCVTKLEILSYNNSAMLEAWYRNDDPKYGANKNELKLKDDGRYRLKFTNMDEIDIVVAFITGFYQCTKHEKFMNSSDFAKIHDRTEVAINEMFMNLGKVVTEEDMLDRKKAMIRKTHTKLLYGSVGEILAIIVVACWQIFYLMSILEKKLVV